MVAPRLRSAPRNVRRQMRSAGLGAMCSGGGPGDGGSTSSCPRCAAITSRSSAKAAAAPPSAVPTLGLAGGLNRLLSSRPLPVIGLPAAALFLAFFFGRDSACASLRPPRRAPSRSCIHRAAALRAGRAAMAATDSPAAIVPSCAPPGPVGSDGLTRRRRGLFLIAAMFAVEADARAARSRE